MRIDLGIICSYVKSNQDVLDLGCGDGALLSLLRDQKSINGAVLGKVQERKTDGIGLLSPSDAADDLTVYTPVVAGTFKQK